MFLVASVRPIAEITAIGGAAAVARHNGSGGLKSVQCLYVGGSVGGAVGVDGSVKFSECVAVIVDVGDAERVAAADDDRVCVCVGIGMTYALNDRFGIK